ncbi:MAG: hypothetical protein K9M96_01045 [Deltaproteobacteria bacterium]|nr:hypothetical protein [Deltaproteobacteria bacterium]MCF8118725.1 hypothetical protein [Deltaproteobacteria bacterium]
MAEFTLLLVDDEPNVLQALARRPLRRQVRTQAAVLRALERAYPGINRNLDP